MSSAREFLDEVAQILRNKGREVQITETEETYGKFTYLSSVAPNWYDSSISLAVRYSNSTKRWAIVAMDVRLSSGKTISHDIRTNIRIAAEVYA